jgi:hypothetical protein
MEITGFNNPKFIVIVTTIKITCKSTKSMKMLYFFIEGFVPEDFCKLFCPLNKKAQFFILIVSAVVFAVYFSIINQDFTACNYKSHRKSDTVKLQVPLCWQQKISISIK